MLVSIRFVLLTLSAVVAVLLGVPGAAQAHEERDPQMPDGSGHVPTYRSDGPQLLVCKSDRADFERRIAGFPADLRDRNLALWNQCQSSGYRHLQQAVDAVQQPGVRIAMLPGRYLEEPSLAPPAGDCAHLPARLARMGYQVLSYEQQLACPHNQNLVGVFGKRDLQIEGTGAAPTDVVIDAGYAKLNAIRADRSDGFYLRNLTAQRTTFNAVYIMESDGFVIDQAIGRWNDEYGFLTFADDHGKYVGCEAYGNGDSGIYPGAAHDINVGRGHDVQRYAIEISGCWSHDNLMGYSGTAGDSVWAHDNRFTGNSTGVSTDSAFPDHPGLPQNHAKFERNDIGDNNQDYYKYVRDGTCAKPSADRGYERGVVCPAVGVPPGTGILNPGGNDNIWRDNWIYGHRYAGYVLSWVPGFVRSDNRWAAQFDTSHENRYFGNRLGVAPDGRSRPNRIDAWWDGQGRANCWQSMHASEPAAPPRCGSDGAPAGPSTARLVAEPGKALKLYECNDYDLLSRRIPSNCDWFGASGAARVEVQAAALEGLLVVVLAAALWRRRAIGLVALAAGAVVGVIGSLMDGSWATGVGLVLLGLGWLALGWNRRAAGSPGYGWTTIALGVVAVVNGIDRGLLMVPWLPVPPSLIRVLLELVWILWTAVLVLRRRPLRSEARGPDRRGRPAATVSP